MTGVKGKTCVCNLSLLKLRSTSVQVFPILTWHHLHLIRLCCLQSDEMCVNHRRGRRQEDDKTSEDAYMIEVTEQKSLKSTSSCCLLLLASYSHTLMLN